MAHRTGVGGVGRGALGSGSEGHGSPRSGRRSPEARLAKLTGLAKVYPCPQALRERVTKPDGTASTRRVMESKLTEAW